MKKIFGGVIIGLVAISGCQSSTDVEDDPIYQKVNSPIDNPFTATSALGRDAKAENFIIKTSVGNTVYSVEIPHGGQDYDIVVPLAKLDVNGSPGSNYKDSDAVITDQELVSSLPTLENKKSKQTAMLDKAFGVGKTEGVKQPPSYTLKLVKIKDLYKAKKYEQSLIEINQLLSYYPTSSQLHKMKGSVFLKLRQLDLAETSWQRAIELKPNDTTLRRGLAQLQRKIEIQNKSNPNKPATDFAH